MADTLKILGQSNPSATTYTTLYTVPNLTMTTTSTLVVCNESAVAGTFRVSIHDAGADTGAPTGKQFIFYDTTLGGNSTLTAVIGMTLYQTDVIQVYASSANLAFNLFGVETS